MRRHYQVGEKVLYRDRVCVVMARYDRISSSGYTLPLLHVAYRIKYVQPQRDGITPYGKRYTIVFGDELRLLPPRTRGIRRTIAETQDYQVL
jgi:hypothetical protein